MISYGEFESEKKGRDAVAAEPSAGFATPPGATLYCDPRKNPPLVGGRKAERSADRADCLLSTSPTFFFTRLPEGLLPAGPSLKRDFPHFVAER
jgi:hypothetical protein